MRLPPLTPVNVALGAGVALAGVLIASGLSDDQGGTDSGGGADAGSGAGGLRDQAMALLKAYLPCKTGSEKFAEIAKDYGGIGTTCGYLTGWLLWRLGCVDPQIVNRSEPAEGLHYEVGMNIARLVGGGKALGAWRTQADASRPLPGDCCYYAMDPPASVDGVLNYHEHVNVAVDCSGQMWKSGDGGRTAIPEGTQMAEFVSRKRLASGQLDYYGGPRRLIGWVDITAVPLLGTPRLT